MPYIKSHEQQKIWASIHETGIPELETPGELNYLVSQIVKYYLDQRGLSYQTCNDIVGALENAKNEFQRRVQHPYEIEKQKMNGDIYT